MHTPLPLLLRTLSRISPATRSYLAAVTSRVSDKDSGWHAMSGTERDQSWSDYLQQLTDTLEAWRKNPLARRIVALTTDYVVADGITLSSTSAPLQRFITEWWHHPQNHMDMRLPGLCEDLTRDGELFPVLSINKADGMSYVRFKPASRIDQIQWDKQDYEKELRYHEMAFSIDNQPGKWWISPKHPTAHTAKQIMYHYAVNRPGGCVRGESDLAPALVWLKIYSEWLQDRARLNWAARMFLWDVTVPTGKVDAKKHLYASPPSSGSIVVHDQGEEWKLHTPSIRAPDAKDDGRAIKRMAAVATGTPLHHLSDEENANLATATAMQESTNRHYARRQRFFTYMLRDLTARAYNLWLVRGGHRWTKATYRDITATVQEIVREDNLKLAQAGRAIVGMLAQLRDQLTTAGLTVTDDMNRLTLNMAFKFAGEILSAPEIDALLGYTKETP